MFTSLILAAPVSALFPPTLLFALSLPGFPVYAPAAPAPLPLVQRVEGAENPLCPAPCAPRAFPFPWHEEGCPGPPLSLRFTPPAAPSPLISRQRGERDGIPPPFPAPSHARLPICAREPYAKGWRARGRDRAERRSNHHNKRWGGNTVTDVAAAQRATQAGAGARERKGGGAEKGSGGGREP